MALAAASAGVWFLFAACHRAEVGEAGHAHGAIGEAHGTEDTAVQYKAGHGLKLNATATAFIQLATAEVATRDFPGVSGAAAVPESAVLRTVKGDFVFVANGAWLLRTPVKLGVASLDGWRAVTDGLYEGDTVAVRGVPELWLAEIQAVNGGVGCADGH